MKNEFTSSSRLEADSYVGVVESKPNRKEVYEICKVNQKEGKYYFHYHNKKFIYNIEEG